MASQSVDSAADAASVCGQFSDLRGKRVLVTGGSAGIGKAIAEAFDANGAVVTVMARNREKLEAVAAQLKQGHVVTGDLTNMEDCKRAGQEAVEAMGGLDVLVNNGGPTNDTMLGRAEEPEGLMEGFRLHVASAFAMAKACEKALIESKGCIINVSSAAGTQAAEFPLVVPYNVAKAAQDSLTRSLARQYGPFGVRVNGLAPAWVRTPVIDNMANMFKMTPESFKGELAKLHALQRTSSPQEQAAIVVFLASKGASFITGTTLLADGGITLMTQTWPPFPSPEPAAGHPPLLP